MLGPHYKKNAPFTLNLGYDLAGENFVLSDKKLNVRCEPVEGEVLGFWQADSSRDYDNLGYTLRGMDKSHKNGNYFLNIIFLYNIPRVISHGLVTFM